MLSVDNILVTMEELVERENMVVNNVIHLGLIEQNGINTDLREEAPFIEYNRYGRGIYPQYNPVMVITQVGIWRMVVSIRG